MTDAPVLAVCAVESSAGPIWGRRQREKRVSCCSGSRARRFVCEISRAIVTVSNATMPFWRELMPGKSQFGGGGGSEQ